MKRIMAALLLCLFSIDAQAADDRLQLALKEAIRLAVEKNLDVRAELYNPAMAEATIRQNSGIYDTVLNLLTSFQHSTTQPASPFLSGALVNKQNVFKINPGVSQLIPTGGTVGLTFDNAFNNNNSNVTMNNYWQSDLTLNLIQPLLKNIGRDATELNINVARYSKEGSLEHFKSTLLDTTAKVRTEYNKLYSLREQLEVKKTSLLLAKKILLETQSRVRAGVLPAMENLNAEFGVASREKELIDAEKAVRDQNDVLHVLLQIPGKEDIVPVDIPSKEPLQTNEADMIRRALDFRPEIREQRANIRSNELQARVARNRTLPDLNFNASVAATGLDKHYNRSLEKVGSGDFPVWSAAFQFSYPLGNNAAENDYIKSKLKVEQTRTQVQSLEANVQNEVKTAIRGVESGYKQIEVTDRGRAFAEERLRAFIKKNEVGLATTKDVLDVENDLVTAKSNQINALVGYQDNITQLWRATGELLEREGIRVTETEGDELYQKHARD